MNLKNRWLNSYIYLIFYYRVFKKPKSVFSSVISIMSLGLIGCFLYLVVLGYLKALSYNPRTLENLDINEGILQSAWYKAKGTGGTLRLDLNEKEHKFYQIRKSEREIYSKLIGERVKIYSEPDILFYYDHILQLEDKNGIIYIKYDYENKLKEPERNEKTTFFCLKASLFFLILIFVLNFKGNKPENFRKEVYE
ncbi:hypothetical protein OFO03_02500 [Campylobacter sp. JMF_02 ED1]|uniref:hypothetical protein n=1 Tax=unclassified Campylobacter TaxID=2593542 RepID=UPI0022E9C9F0|nr:MULTISPECIES: hypothetical protein [unclassified Campylobacter]MDA3049820.1 hypothetical protein [Campylobacter sp. JMF_15 NE4]MDA3050778.1 hypothetical protein [Campylobacter sp. JMF_02 ED1]